jgi:urate oxidase
LQQELFAAHIGIFMVQKYAHLHKAIVDIEKLKWTRAVVHGKEHAHTFIRDGEEKEITTAEVRGFLEKRTDNALTAHGVSQVDASNGKQKLSVKITSGVKDLLGS